MEQAPNKPHSKYEHVYPIVRIHISFDQIYPTNILAVIKVLTSEDAAEAEVSRLNQVNAGKSCTYLYCISRLVE